MTCLAELPTAIAFSLPLLLAGLVHMYIITYNLLAPLAKRPLDLGLCLRGNRLLGDNKTMRGCLAMIIGTIFWTTLFASIGQALPALRGLIVADFHKSHPIAWGFLLGLGCVFGEFPNSFLKRQFGIGPGNLASGHLRPLFWLLDQIDSLLGVLVVVSIVWRPSLCLTTHLILLALILHPLGTSLLDRGRRRECRTS